MNRFGLKHGNYWRSFGVLPGVAAFIAACSSYPPPIPISQNHIQSEPEVASKNAGIPAPVRIATFVPPPTPAVKPQTYSVVVNEVPVKELLFVLARDSGLNVDIHPAIQGLVTMNAVNEPLETILERLSSQINLRYKIDGSTLSITPDTPYMQTYRVDYVNFNRNTSSDIGITTQIASTGTIDVKAGGGSSGDAGNSSSTMVKTTSDHKFWEVLAENIRNMISATKSVTLTAEDKAARIEAVRAEKDERMRQAEAVARAGSGAPSLFSSAFGATNNAIERDQKDRVVVNPVAGVVAVLATERQHKLVGQYLDIVSRSVQRQVLVEATIVEVNLSDKYQAGVDWSRVASTGNMTQSVLGGNLFSPPNLSFTYANPNSRLGNISTTLKLLEQFGDTRVLSSPKIMALNNQTAVLKVVDNQVYFSITVTPAKYDSLGGIATPAVYSSTAHTVPVGLVMSVTPQINENGEILLIVRPTISRKVGEIVDPNPEIIRANALQQDERFKIQNKVPVIQVREMESVLRVNSGQTVVMGGLMRDDVSKSRDGVPVLARIPGLGDIFSYRNDDASKTELVIFLRPTVISNTSLDSDELSVYRHYLPSEAPRLVAQP